MTEVNDKNLDIFSVEEESLIWMHEISGEDQRVHQFILCNPHLSLTYLPKENKKFYISIKRLLLLCSSNAVSVDIKRERVEMWPFMIQQDREHHEYFKRYIQLKSK